MDRAHSTQVWLPENLGELSGQSSAVQHCTYEPLIDLAVPMSGSRITTTHVGHSPRIDELALEHAAVAR